MEFDGTEYNKREEPYICDHADASCVCSKGMDGPHSPKQTRSYCFSAQRWVCDVPYTEQPESTESKLFICMRCKKRAHIVTDLVYEHDCESKVWAPVKSREEKEPKTKRMAVVWIGDVDHDLNPELASGKHVQILAHDQIFGDIIIGESELIDANRVTDKVRSKGKLNEFRIIKIKPPTPEPETVEDMPQASDYGGYNGPKTIAQFYFDMGRWQRRQIELKKAMERQKS